MKAADVGGTIMIKKRFVIYRSLYRIFAKSLCVFLLLTCLTVAAFTEEDALFFTGTPAVSPDGKKVVFSYAEDLWIVDSSGGTAYRLTAMQGRELNPRFSPDGRWLAFSGSSVGSFDVYVMPVAGGTIRQLTFHGSEDIVDSWSPDSNHIFFPGGVTISPNTKLMPQVAHRSGFFPIILTRFTVWSNIR